MNQCPACGIWVPHGLEHRCQPATITSGGEGTSSYSIGEEIEREERIRKDERSKVLKEVEELKDALISMYEQYCSDGHHFMSAGEYASKILEQYGYDTFDEAGRIQALSSLAKPVENQESKQA